MLFPVSYTHLDVYKRQCIHRLTADEARDFSFTLKEPRPWWPRPYGDPFLYDVCIQLLHGGATVDKKEFHFGLRIVELQQNYEDGGRSFLFRINDRRLFLRGDVYKRQAIHCLSPV